MLQKNEPVEILSTEVRTAATNELLTGKELSTQEMDAELAELTACLEAGNTRSKNRQKTIRKKINRRVLTGFVPFAIVLLGCLFAILHHMVNPMIGMLALFTIPVFSKMSTIYMSRLRIGDPPAPVEQERLAAQRLTEIDDIRAVVPIIDALSWSADRTVDPQLWQALGRLLPRLTVEQARALGPERHGR